VTVSPADGNLITGGSEERRKLINEVISQYNHNYLHDMMQYNRALEQRNAILKKFSENRSFDAEVLEIWNEQLVATGNRVYQYRMEFCSELFPIFQQYYREISGCGESVELIYSSQLHNNDFSIQSITWLFHLVLLTLLYTRLLLALQRKACFRLLSRSRCERIVGMLYYIN
jgi:DNA replication and repair protein RecF